MNNIQKIRYAIYNNPLLIGILLRDTSIKKGIIYSEMKKVLPCKLGIEFELSGDFCKGFSNKYHKKFTKSTKCDEDCLPFSWGEPSPYSKMAKFYGVENLSIDGYIDDDHLCEVRVCLKDFHQLKGLYLIMKDMSEFCKLHEGGGIHIHTDMSMFNYTESKKIEIMGYITNHLDDVQKIFPKYTGKFNKKEVGFKKKGTWVNLSRLNTFEFRIAPLTFDYKELIKWIHGVIKFRANVIHYCRLKRNYENSNIISKSETLLDSSMDIPTPLGQTNQLVCDTVDHYIRNADNEYWTLHRLSNQTTYY